MRRTLCALAMPLAVACVDPAAPADADAASTRPQWVVDGAYVRRDFAYGVGAIRGVRNPALARVAAGNRARAALARLLYGADEQGVVTATLSGVEILRHWVDPQDGTVFALARLRIDPPAGSE